MSNSPKFPEIICLDGRWFLRYLQDGETKEQIELPYAETFCRLYEALSMLLDIQVDDCGANLDRCLDFYNQAKEILAGASKQCEEYALQLKEDITLNNLYSPDEDEPWYNK